MGEPAASKLPLLIYFRVRGRAEVVRLLLAEAGVAYREHPVAQGTEPKDGLPTDFAELKATGMLPFNAVPFWEDADGFRLAQSLAIAGHIARRHGLFGKSGQDVSLIEQALGGVEDARLEVRRIVTCAPEQRASIREDVAKNGVPRWYGHFQRLIERNGSAEGFLAGDALSVADFALWYWMEMVRDNNLGASLVEFRALSAFFDRIAARPRIAAYLASPARAPFLALPV